jgi:hypothetical protein
VEDTKNELGCVIFVSTIVKDLTDEKVKEILQVSREDRLQKGLTGLSILADLNTLVLIEGEKDRVKKQFEKAKKLQGHFNLIKVYEADIQQRSFEGYPLAFHVLSGNKFKHLADFQTAEKKEYLKELINREYKIGRILRDFVHHNT